MPRVWLLPLLLTGCEVLSVADLDCVVDDDCPGVLRCEAGACVDVGGAPGVEGEGEVGGAEGEGEVVGVEGEGEVVGGEGEGEIVGVEGEGEVVPVGEGEGEVVVPITCDDVDGDGRGVGPTCLGPDNCAGLANADQHDEDSDGFGDPCDNCPGVADLNVDRDGDGLGDSCDPRPDQPGDRLVLFDPFVVADPAWSVRSGGWVIANDVLQTASTESAQLLVRTDLSLTRLRVELHGVITAFGDPVPQNIGVLTSFDGTTNSGLMCDGIGNNVLDAIAAHEVANNAAFAPPRFGTIAPAATVGTPFVVVNQSIDRAVSCGFASVDGVAVGVGDYTTTATGTGVALRANRVATTLSSIAVYEIGP